MFLLSIYIFGATARIMQGQPLFFITSKLKHLKMCVYANRQDKDVKPHNGCNQLSAYGYHYNIKVLKLYKRFDLNRFTIQKAKTKVEMYFNVGSDRN